MAGFARQFPFVIVVVFAILFAAPALSAPSVVPSPRVTAAVVVRAQPTASSEALARMRPGEFLPLQQEISGWFQVLLPDGRTGYVSKAWADIVPEAVTPAPPVWKIHFVDVGTGLATFVEGPDFALIYDGGSNDDYALGSRNRLLAYLHRVRPDLQVIDHIILSHPHRDHVELLPDLFDGYQVRNVWDSGRIYDICGYRSFLQKISTEPGVVYHDAASEAGVHAVSLPAKACYGHTAPLSVHIADGTPITRGLKVPLGAGASMTFLTADAGSYPDPNENSVVVRLDLGADRFLFMGDAEASPDREPPSIPPRPNFAEGQLLTCCAADIQADFMVVGHHGSMSSSRATFLNAVGAKIFVISSGPKDYGRAGHPVTLPDPEVVHEVESRGTLWRTDFDDPDCRTDAAKIGTDADNNVGGCDNILVRVPASGPPLVNYERIHD
ncbi:MBL fold metallo-hydrolase [Sphingomonas sp.]|uniref:MBL fold metallo-hydrolase n=1 Tax=Sphingomonas sp. TaxID=28214 RepID=UPI0038AA1170